MAGEPRILRDPLTEEARAALAAEPFGDMFKLVADVQRGVVAVGGEFHSDAEPVLLADGSRQDHLWGANFYPARPAGARLEYSALINISPARNNRGHLIESENVKASVRALVERFIGAA